MYKIFIYIGTRGSFMSSVFHDNKIYDDMFMFDREIFKLSPSFYCLKTRTVSLGNGTY